MSETYLTITPFGTVDAVFEDDGTGVLLRGPDDAVAHIKRVMATCCDHRGMTITTDSVEPSAYFDFCQPAGSGIIIMEPADLTLDQGLLDSMLDNDEDEFDGQDEFDACTPANADDDDAAPVMDGDFKGHAFRGNQHVSASRESSTAVHSSRKAKRAEMKGDQKALKKAHKSAHYAHLAAAEETTGTTRKYHRTMAKFHGKQSGAVLDDASGAFPRPASTTAATNRGPVNLFSESDKVISLDDNKDYTVTGQRGIKVSVKGRSEPFHANRLKLASGKKPPTIVMDGAEPEAALDGVDDASGYRIETATNFNGRTTATKTYTVFRKSDNRRFGDFKTRKAAEEEVEMNDKIDAKERAKKLDGVEELPALRAQLAAATSTMERLRLAQAIKAARTAPPVAPPPPAPADNDASRVNALKRLVPKDDIRSDDPQLIEKLTAKLNYLSAWGDFMRKANKLLRKGDDAGLLAMGFTAEQLPKFKAKDFAGRVGFADYMMSNNNGVIGSTRKRLEAAMRDREPAPVPPPAPPAKSMAEVALAALQGLGWTVSQYGANVLVRSFVGMGKIGTMTVPDGTRNVYARVGDGELVVKYGEQVVVSSVTLAATEEEVQAQARAVNADTEAFAVAESRRTNPPKVDPADNAGYAQWASAVQAALQAKGMEAGAAQGVMDDHSSAVEAAWKAREPAQAVADRIAPAAKPAAGRFRYALVNRPADLGAIPKVPYTVEPRPAAGQPHHDMARHGILVTERELTEKEVKDFELAPLIDGPLLDVLAGKIAEGMAEYAARYVEIEKEDAAEFYNAVMGAARRSGSGIRYSIGQPDALVDRVLVLLEGMAGAAKPEPGRSAQFASYEKAIKAGQATPGMLEQINMDTRLEDGEAAVLIAMVKPAAPTPAADTARAADLALLSLVASGKHPNMLEPELADEIESALTRHPDDKAIQDLGERAIVAYSNGLMAATG